MMNFFKNLLSLAVVSTTLMGVGIMVNFYFPWSWLVSFFVLIRRFALLFDFFWDTDTMFMLIGLSLLLESIFWIFYAVIYLVRVSGINR